MRLTPFNGNDSKPQLHGQNFRNITFILSKTVIENASNETHFVLAYCHAGVTNLFEQESYVKGTESYEGQAVYYTLQKQPPTLWQHLSPSSKLSLRPTAVSAPPPTTSCWCLSVKLYLFKSTLGLPNDQCVLYLSGTFVHRLPHRWKCVAEIGETWRQRDRLPSHLGLLKHKAQTWHGFYWELSVQQIQTHRGL